MPKRRTQDDPGHGTHNKGEVPKDAQNQKEFSKHHVTKLQPHKRCPFDFFVHKFMAVVDSYIVK